MNTKLHFPGKAFFYDVSNLTESRRRWAVKYTWHLSVCIGIIHHRALALSIYTAVLVGMAKNVWGPSIGHSQNVYILKLIIVFKKCIYVLHYGTDTSVWKTWKMRRVKAQWVEFKAKPSLYLCWVLKQIFCNYTHFSIRRRRHKPSEWLKHELNQWGPHAITFILESFDSPWL